MLLADLSDAQKAGIAAMGAAFIVFALASSFVIPRRKPNFPGGRGVWPYVVLVACFFAAMMAVVVFVGKEKSEAKAEPTSPTSPAPSPAPAPGPKGNPAAGKAVFLASGCTACHTFKPAGSTGVVGPDLSHLAADAKKANRGSLDQYTTESIVDPSAYLVPGFADQMTKGFGKTLGKQKIADLVAFLTQGASG